MPHPSLQRALTLICYGLAGVLLLGSVLDAFTNTVQLSMATRLAFLVVILLLWGALEVLVRRRGVPWRVRSGNTVAIRSLGAMPRMFFIGVVVLLATATISSSWNEKTPPETNEDAGVVLRPQDFWFYLTVFRSSGEEGKATVFPSQWPYQNIAAIVKIGRAHV